MGRGRLAMRKGEAVGAAAATVLAASVAAMACTAPIPRGGQPAREAMVCGAASGIHVRMAALPRRGIPGIGVLAGGMPALAFPDAGSAGAEADAAGVTDADAKAAAKAAGVAAGMASRLGAGDRYLLAKIAMAEAEGEDTEGKALVMLVVLNRMAAEGFPDAVGDVIRQPGQFSPVASGRFDESEPDGDCWDALSLILDGGWDGSMGATYFESRSESEWHARNLRFLFRHGRHYFYRERE